MSCWPLSFAWPTLTLRFTSEITALIFTFFAGVNLTPTGFGTCFRKRMGFAGVLSVIGLGWTVSGLFTGWLSVLGSEPPCNPTKKTCGGAGLGFRSLIAATLGFLAGWVGVKLAELSPALLRFTRAIGLLLGPNFTTFRRFGSFLASFNSTMGLPKIASLLRRWGVNSCWTHWFWLETTPKDPLALASTDPCRFGFWETFPQKQAASSMWGWRSASKSSYLNTSKFKPE